LSFSYSSLSQRRERF